MNDRVHTECGRIRRIIDNCRSIAPPSRNASIRIVAGREAKPFDRLFESCKHLDVHSPIESNGFPKSSGITKRLGDDICKLWNDFVLADKPQSVFRCEFTVVETLEIFGIS